MRETPQPVSTIRERSAAVTDSTLELLSFATPNPPGETDALVDWTERYLTERGLSVDRIVSDPAKPNLLATVPGESERTLLYLGHFDTVPYDEDEWSHDPLGERVENRIYGRGATDMKGPLAAMLESVRSFAETGTTPPVTLALGLVSDEEVAGDAGLPTMLDADVLDADACVIGETTCEGGRHSVTAADRGSIWLTLEATGTSAHGSRPMLGENAIDRLYEGIETLRTRFGSTSLDVPAAVEPIIDESVEYYGPKLGRDEARLLFEQPTINLGTIEGGESINTVPDSARARIDIRLAPGVQTPEMLADIRACARDCEGVELVDVSWSVGTYESLDEPVVDATARLASDVTGERVYRRSATGGGDAKTLRNEGIPTIEFALGTDTVHAVDEYTTVEALHGNAAVYTRLPYELAEAWEGQ
jgi:succinyl-diaminopimelate desuccinylase